MVSFFCKDMSGKRNKLTVKNKEAFEMHQELKKALNTKLGVIKRNQHIKPALKYLEALAFEVDGKEVEKVDLIDEKLAMPRHVSLNQPTDEKKAIQQFYHKKVKELWVKQAPPEEIRKELYEISGMRFNLTTIKSYCFNNFNSNKDFLSERKKYNEKLEEVPIYNKRYRLEKYQLLLNEALNKFYTNKSVNSIDLVMRVLRSAGDECKEVNNTINIMNQNVVLQSIIEQEKIKEVVGKLPLQELILGKIGARSNISPAILIERLNKSVYSTFNGSSLTTSSSIEGVPSFPEPFLITPEQIKSRVAKKIKEEEAIQDKIRNDYEDIEVDQSVKERLLETVRYKRRLAKEKEIDSEKK